MYDVQFLCGRYGLTVKQVRDRITALAPTLTPHVLQGKHGAKVLKDGGLAIFDRLIQLERGGLSVSAAVEMIQKDGLNGSESSSSTSVGLSGGNRDGRVFELMSHQIEDLRTERDRLLSIIEQQGEQMRALMPGPKAQNGNDGQGNQLTRWRALKIAILGR